MLLLAIVASAVCCARTDGDNRVLVREMLDTAGCDFRESVRCYDAMGNVLSLTRRGLLSEGVCGYIDRLRYSYEGNRVVKIDDGGARTTVRRSAACSTS